MIYSLIGNGAGAGGAIYSAIGPYAPLTIDAKI
jgi:hypothetical protein